jgi:DNA-binding MarR family transcriptional regulator
MTGDRADLSKLARALERAGLVERRPHPADPRANQLSLTDRGADVVTAGRQVVVDLEEQRLAALGGPSSERTAQFQAALADLLHHAGDTSTRSATSASAHPKPTKETHP